MCGNAAINTQAENSRVKIAQGKVETLNWQLYKSIQFNEALNYHCITGTN